MFYSDHLKGSLSLALCSTKHKDSISHGKKIKVTMHIACQLYLKDCWIIFFHNSSLVLQCVFVVALLVVVSTFTDTAMHGDSMMFADLGPSFKLNCSDRTNQFSHSYMSCSRKRILTGWISTLKNSSDEPTYKNTWHMRVRIFSRKKKTCKP